MILKKREINNANSFLMEEVPKSIGIKYAPIKIKGCFNIKQQDGPCRIRKKE